MDLAPGGIGEGNEEWVVTLVGEVRVGVKVEHRTGRSMSVRELTREERGLERV